MAKSSTSFKKGQSGNPKGRPKKGTTLAEMFRNALAEAVREEDGYTRLHKIIDKVVQKAEAGDQAAIEYVLARGWGKLIDRIESNVTNKNYDFTNLSLEERMKLLEQLRSASTTVSGGNTDSDNSDTI